MAKRLKYVIGTARSFRFTIQAVDFDGVKTPKNLTGTFVYFELERDGVQILAKDNDGVGGVTLTDPVNGVLVARIEHPDLIGDTGGELDYAVLVREDPGGADTERDQAICGKMDISLAKVNVP